MIDGHVKVSKNGPFTGPVFKQVHPHSSLLTVRGSAVKPTFESVAFVSAEGDFLLSVKLKREPASQLLLQQVIESLWRECSTLHVLLFSSGEFVFGDSANPHSGYVSQARGADASAAATYEVTMVGPGDMKMPDVAMGTPKKVCMASRYCPHAGHFSTNDDVRGLGVQSLNIPNGAMLQKGKSKAVDDEPSLADQLNDIEALSLAEGATKRRPGTVPKADSLAKLLVQALHRCVETRWLGCLCVHYMVVSHACMLSRCSAQVL
jgi:hypothetical protein